ncbi:MAG TPA: hypothetical protein VI796_06070, partial [Candidatus Thermoplasmatota archaeon]|nr:hypothetical protein [Candidatus Thermoplasmatota archaeon]
DRERDWGAALHGDRPTLLHVLDRVGSPGLAADVLGVSRAGVHKAIQAWASLGLVRRVGTRHALAEGQGRLRAFLAETARTEALHRMRAIDSAGELRWSLGPELLYWAPRPSTSARVQPAGPTALAQYGITTFGRGAYHALSHRTLDGADAALQTLLVGGDDALHRSTAALLVEKERLDLRRKAPLYGLEEEASGVAAYLAERRDRVGFLPWSEYDGLRRLYAPAV